MPVKAMYLLAESIVAFWFERIEVYIGMVLKELFVFRKHRSNILFRHPTSVTNDLKRWFGLRDLTTICICSRMAGIPRRRTRHYTVRRPEAANRAGRALASILCLLLDDALSAVDAETEERILSACSRRGGVKQR
jgi:hypothetical protein